MPRGRALVNGAERNIREVVISVVVIALFIGIYAVFEFTNWIPVRWRGFFCDDQMIRYPYSPASIFPTWVVLVSFILIPIIFFAFVELVLAKNPWRFFYTWAHFKLAFVFSGLTTDSLKCFVGRLRPYFLDVCRPDVLVNATCNHLDFVTEYKCLGAHGLDEYDLLQARKSWPSGHSTTSFCGAVFVCFYASRRLPSSQPHAGRQVIVFLILIFSICVSVSRVVDHKHHAEDVITGSLIGAGFASFSGIVWWLSMDALEINEKDMAR